MAQALKVLGLKYISTPDFAPYWENHFEPYWKKTFCAILEKKRGDGVRLGD